MKNGGRGVQLLLTRNPKKDFYPEGASRRRSAMNLGCASPLVHGTRITVHGTPSTERGLSPYNVRSTSGVHTMRYRKFGRTGWNVSEIGYGMWGLAGWTGSDDAESLDALQRAVDLGCNFLDTAWAYGAGNSEQILGKVLRAN